jgi:hypothetical protein
MHVFRRDLRVGIGHREDDRVLGHDLDHVLGHRSGDGEAHEYVRALERLDQSARFRLDRVRGLELVHALGAAFVDHAFGVADDDIVMWHAELLDEADA